MSPRVHPGTTFLTSLYRNLKPFNTAQYLVTAPQDDPLQDGGTCAGNKRHKDMGHSNGRHTFAQVIEAAWDYLEASTTHAIRRSCRDGLALHDRVCTGMTVALGWIGTEEEVQGTLARAAARGFKPKSITVETIFSGKPGQDKNQSL